MTGGVTSGPLFRRAGLVAALAVASVWAGASLAAAAPTDHVVQAGTIKVHYLRAGSGDTMIVLVHGWPQSAREWRSVVPILSQRFTVVAPDLRGVGGTDAPPDGSDKATLARDLHELIVALKPKRVVVVGHDDWRKVLSVNLDSIFLVTSAFLPGMRERKWGRIVSATSTTFGMVAPNATHYIASKMGVIGFTRGLASEVGDDGVTVNCIAPGATRTPGMAEEWGQDIPVIEQAKAMQAIKRAEQPEDLVGAISFLTSDDAAFITGQTLVVDGGMVRV